MEHERARADSRPHPTLAERVARPRVAIRAIAALLIASSMTDATAGLGIVDLGQLPGTDADSLFAKMGISADGRIAVGSVDNRAFFWDGSLHELQGARAATAASADGTVIVGTLASPGHAFRWTAADGLQDLGVPEGSTDSQALGVSGDGSIVVGVASTKQGSVAWIWNATDGMRSLATPDPGMSSVAATAISTDGRVVVGFSGNASGTHAFRWTAETGMADITPDLAPPGSAMAEAVNDDGSTVVGTYNANPQGVGMRPDSFLWTAAHGFEDLASADGGSRSQGHALAVDRTGAHVFGYLFDYLAYASLWTRQTGTLRLDEYLPSQGLDLAGWELSSADAVSADGDVVVGTGIRMKGAQAVRVAWRVSGLSTVGFLFADGFESDTRSARP